MHWYLGVDGISIFLVLLSALLFPLVIILGRNRQNSRAYFAWILLLEAAVMGSFVSLDLLVFFFMFELTLVPSYFIIAGWGHQRRAYAALEVLPLHVPRLSLPPGRHPRPGLHPRVAVPLPDVLARAADADPSLVEHRDPALPGLHRRPSRSRRPLFPLHTWSPDAYTEAPEEGSVLLSGVLAKLGPTGSSASTSASSPRRRAPWPRSC